MTTATEVPAQFNVEAIRRDFPILSRSAASGRPLIYLDNAASTQHPDVVIDAMSDCYRQYFANVHRGIHTLSEQSTQAFEASRVAVADFLSAASPHEVIFTSGTTAGINLVARSWGDANMGSDDHILLTIAEHHANIVPWQQLAQRTGCQIVFLPITDDGRIEEHVLRDHLEKYRPKLFAFSALSNTLGTEFPVVDWVRIAHGFGAVVLVDAAQAVPHTPVNVRDWDADFVVFSGHKICGPTGIGILYGKEAILDSMPPFLGGGAMIRTVSTDGFEPGQLPQKFEAGTPPIAEAIGLASAIAYVSKIGLTEIHQHEKALVRVALDGLADVEGLRIFGPSIEHRAGIISFVIDGVHPHDISQWLDTRGIAVRAGHHCTMPLHQRLEVSATCRASFYLYNTAAEAKALVAAVGEVQQKFARPRRARQR
jgi:cysteine desulfurase / selenocysteine lyase